MSPRPRVTLHFAQSVDGRIAARSGNARGISGPEATRFAHELRAESDAVLVGSGTALIDDPELTVRLAPGKHPLRVVLDARARLPRTAKLATDGIAPTLQIACISTDAPPLSRVERVLVPRAASGEGVDLHGTLERLAERGVERLLVEGGRRVITSFLAAGLVDRVLVGIAPLVIGEGVSAVGELGVARVDEALRFSLVKTFRLGDDVMIELERRS